MMERKTLGIIEQTMHNEVVWAYYQQFKDEYDKIHIIVTQKCYEQLYDLHNNSDIVWTIAKDSMSFSDFLSSIKTDLDKLNLLIFTTILPKTYSFFIRHKFVSEAGIVLHDLNHHFNAIANFRIPNSNHRERLRSLLKMGRYFLTNEKKRNIDFIHSFDFIIVPTKYIKASLEEIYSQNISIKMFPFDIEAPKNYFALRENNEYFEIVIPGAIDEKSRDYQMVYEALSQLTAEMNQSIRITLLGRAVGNYGNRMQEKYMALAQNNLEIKLFPDFVPQEQFDDIMVSANILLLPIMSEMGIYPVVEQNGYTCVSGNINDMIKYNKTALIPSFYPLTDSQELHAIRYNTLEELTCFIRQKIMSI